MRTTNNKEVKTILENHVLEYFESIEDLRKQIVYIINPSTKDARTWETLTFSEKQHVKYAIEQMVKGGMFLVYNKDIIDFLMSLKLTNQKGTERSRDYYDSKENILDYYSNIIVLTIARMVQ